MYKNKAYCKLCLDTIESTHRHDFVTCKCGSLSLDGGLAYRRVLWRGGEYADVYGEIKEEIVKEDIVKTANVSAVERDLEQEFYHKLYEKLAETTEKEN